MLRQIIAFCELPSSETRVDGGGPVSAMNRVGRRAHLLLLLYRCEGGDDFFEARIATQGVPKRQQFQVAVGESARGTDGDGKLLAGEIFITNPRSDHREVFDHSDSVNCIFFHRKKLNCTSAFPQRFLFPSQPSVDQTQHAERRAVAFGELEGSSAAPRAPR